MYSKQGFFKGDVKPAHWVGHSQLRYLDADDFFKRTPVVDEKEASVTVNAITQSVSGGKRIQFYCNKKKYIYLKRLVMMLM